MNIDGSCPTCQRPVKENSINGTITARNLDIKRLAVGQTDEDISIPWHFKLLVGALIMYLGWRVIDLFR